MPAASRYQRLNKGAFSKVDRVLPDGGLLALEWLHCREYFQDESKGIRRFLFCHRRKSIKNVAAFMGIVESTLAVEERSVFGPTQRNNISWARVSPWWMGLSMRRSLLTILMRCSQNYSVRRGDFDEALRSVQYARETDYAVRRFLNGHTRYTGRCKGWYNQFRPVDGVPVSEDVVDRLLVRPLGVVV